MTAHTLVIGSTGSVGRELLALLGRSGHPVRSATREPGASRLHSNSPAEFVEFDFERPQTFAPALAGVDRVFLIARPGDEQPDRVAVPLIDEMKRQGVRHVVNLSAMGVERREDISLRRVELYLEDSGIGFTHLRPNFFMQVFRSGPLLAGIRATDAIQIPAADAKMSYVDVRDIAAVAAAALTGQGHVGNAYAITGGEALDHHAIAGAISAAAGKTVQYIPIKEEAARKAISAAGFSPERVERLIGFCRLVREGFCAPLSHDVERVLGRPPILFARFAKDNASCWM